MSHHRNQSRDVSFVQFTASSRLSLGISQKTIYREVINTCHKGHRPELSLHRYSNYFQQQFNEYQLLNTLLLTWTEHPIEAIPVTDLGI
jgi:hypothetical protein